MDKILNVQSKKSAFSTVVFEADDFESRDEDISGDEKLKQALKLCVRDLNLNDRMINCFIRANLYTLADIVSCKESDLLKINNFGPKSLLDLQKVLDDVGVGLQLNMKEKVDKLLS